MNTDMKTAVGVGLAGAHRVGKSTVARIVAENADRPFIMSAGEAVATDSGIKVYPGMPMIERREYQERVLESFENQWKQEDGLFVCDRTPLDFAAYALADYRPENDRADQHAAWLSDYVKLCLEATKRYFFSVFVIQPGIPYVAAPGKPAPDLIYQETVASLITGLALRLTDACAVSILCRTNTDLDRRVNYVEGQYSQVMRGFILDGIAVNGVH